MDFNYTSIDQQTGVASFGSDNQMYVEFYRGKRLNRKSSIEAGATVYDDVDMVKIAQPGEKDFVHHLATMEYQRRWPQHWALYQQGRKAEQSGIPLDLLLPDSPGTVATLKALHIHSVENLAGLHDSAAMNIPFGTDLVSKAKAYLETAKGGSGFQKITKENEQLKAQLARMQEQIDALAATKDEPRRGPGRPPKSKPEETEEAD